MGTSDFISATLRVTDIQREIYVVPRRDCSVEDVTKELRYLHSSHGSDSKIPVEFETVRRKYCFEYKIDYRNEEVEVVKLSYSFKYKPLSWLPLEGTSYKGVFGLTYKPSELFFL